MSNHFSAAMLKFPGDDARPAVGMKTTVRRPTGKTRRIAQPVSTRRSSTRAWPRTCRAGSPPSTEPSSVWPPAPTASRSRVAGRFPTSVWKRCRPLS